MKSVVSRSGYSIIPLSPMAMMKLHPSISYTTYPVEGHRGWGWRLELNPVATEQEAGSISASL